MFLLNILLLLLSLSKQLLSTLATWVDHTVNPQQMIQFIHRNLQISALNAANGIQCFQNSNHTEPTTVIASCSPPKLPRDDSDSTQSLNNTENKIKTNDNVNIDILNSIPKETQDIRVRVFKNNWINEPIVPQPGKSVLDKRSSEEINPIVKRVKMDSQHYLDSQANSHPNLLPDFKIFKPTPLKRCYVATRTQIGSSATQTLPKITADASTNTPTLTNSNQYQDFMRLIRLFPQLHYATIQGSMRLCNYDLARTIDNILHALQYRAYLDAKSKGFPTELNFFTPNFYTSRFQDVRTAGLSRTQYFDQNQPRTTPPVRTDPGINKIPRMDDTSEKRNDSTFLTPKRFCKRRRNPLTEHLKYISETGIDLSSKHTEDKESETTDHLIQTTQVVSSLSGSVSTEDYICTDFDNKDTKVMKSDCPLGDLYCNEIFHK